MSVLSFGRGKGITAGNGGVLALRGLVPDPEEELGPLRRPGAIGEAQAAAAIAGLWLLGRPALYGIAAAMPFLRLGETIYRRPRPPASLGAVAASVLSVTWPLVASETDDRRETATRLQQRLERRGLRVLRGVEGGEASYLRLPVVAGGAARRLAGLSGARRLGIMSGYPRALADLPGFADRCRNRGGHFPGARELAAFLFTLPTHSRLTHGDVEHLEGWIDAVPQH